jgi:hypothetical protein
MSLKTGSKAMTAQMLTGMPKCHAQAGEVILSFSATPRTALKPTCFLINLITGYLSKADQSVKSVTILHPLLRLKMHETLQIYSKKPLSCSAQTPFYFLEKEREQIMTV